MNDHKASLPGRLGDPTATLETDPRTDPRIAQVIAAFGDYSQGVETLTPESTYDECLAYCDAFERASAEPNAKLFEDLPVFDSVTTETKIIQGVDGNELKLFIHKPVAVAGSLPCIVHIHGGGMVLTSAEDPNCLLWRNTLADLGLLVIGVEFRNGGGRLGPHPFPAGLNDCASAVQWAHENRAELGISSIVVSGESGGGNLSLATALKAKQDGWLDAIDGVYAMCPYISGSYANPPVELPSLKENDGYMLDCAMMITLVKVYDPEGVNSTNALAWPYHARTGELEGLPPHVISVNELDPLRDEGLVYYRKLLRAGVSAVGRTVHGTPHAGDQSFAFVIPDVYSETTRSIVGFAKSLVNIK